MSREIDDRIVAMHFQNEEFERKAKQTINTLEKLQQKMDLEGAADSFTSVTKATFKQLGLKETTKEAKEFSSAIKSAGEMGKKAITSLTSPIRNTMGLLSDLRRYAGIALGFDIGNKLVSTAENVMRAFTVQPVSTGWSEYELKMDSIKTIMTGTKNEFVKAAEAAGKAYDETTHLASVKDALEELNKYADDTIYSFKDMTSNIGKFVNNGVSLDKAVLAMRGISNAAALAGQGTQQASMAMYNLAQAISVGKLTTMDWKSIENANMATLEMKQAILDTAAAAGKLEKIDGKLYITEKDFYQGKKVSAAQKKADLEKRLVTAENFRNMLHYGFADSEVITNVLEIFSGAEELTHARLRAMGFTDDEEIDRLIELGKAAFKAATEVRTFSKMMDALKEAAQSGWAVSFELIFGDMNEATELWSGLNDKLSYILNKSANYRNNVLRRWRGMTYDKDLHEWVRDPNKQDGRQILIESFDRLFTSITQVTSAISRAKEEILGSFTSATLMNITKWIEKISKAFAEWLNADHQKNLKKLTSIFKGFFTVIKIVWNTAKKVISFLSTVLKPVLSFLFDTFAAIGQWLSKFKNLTIGEAIGKIGDWFKKLTREKVADWFVKLGDSVKKVFGDITKAIDGWLRDNGLGEVADWFVGVGDWIKQAWTDLTKWVKGVFESNEWKDVAGFFSGLWDSVIGWFRPNEKNPDGKSDFVVWIETTWNNIVAFFNSLVTDTGLGEAAEKVKNFFIGLWDTVVGWFSPTEYVNKYGQTEYGASPFVQWITHTWEDIKAAFEAITKWPIWNTLGNFFSGIWNKIVEFFMPTNNLADENGHILKDQSAPVVKLINSTWNAIVDAFNAIAGWPIWGTLGDLFSDIWNEIVGWFTPSEQYADEEGNARSPIVKWILDAWNAIVDAFNAVAKWPIWNTLGNIFTDIWNKIVGFFMPTKNLADENGHILKDQSAPVVKWINSTWNTIVDTFNKVASWPIWGTLGEIFSGIWDAILGIFAPKEGATEEDLAAAQEQAEAVKDTSKALNDTLSPIQRLAQTVKGWSGWKTFGEVLSLIFTAFGKLVQTVVDAAIGAEDRQRIETIFENAKFIVIKLLDMITSIGADFMGKNGLLGIVKSGFVVAFGVAAYVLSKIISLRIANKLGNFSNALNGTESLGNTLLKFAGAIALIAYAITKIGEVSDGVFWTGAGRIAGIAIALGAVLVALKGVGNADNESNPVTKGERVLKTLIKWAAIAGIIWIVFDKLPDVITAMKDAHIEKGMFLDLALGITVLMLGMMLVSKALSGVGKIGAEGIVDVLIGVVAMGVALLAAFLMIGGMIKLMAAAYDAGLDQENLDKARKVMEGIGAFFGALAGGLVGAFTGSKDAQQMKAMNDASDDMKEAAEKMEDLNVEGLENFKKAMSTFEELQKAMPKNPERLLGIVQFFTGEQSFDQFTEMLPVVADRLAQVSTTSLGINQTGIDNFARSMSIFGKLQSALPSDPSKGFQGVISFFTGDVSLAEFTERLGPIAKNLATLYDEFQKLAESRNIPVDQIFTNLDAATTVLTKLVELTALISEYQDEDTSFNIGGIYTFFADLFNSDQYQQIQFKDYYDYIHGLSEKYYNLTDEEIRNLTSEPAFQTALGNLGYMAQAIADGINLAIGAASLDINAEPLFTAMANAFTAESAAKIMASGFSKMLEKIGWTTIYDAVDENNPVYQMADSFNQIFEKVAETGKITAMPIIQAMVDSMMNDDSITLMQQGLQAILNLADAGEFNITDLLGFGNLTSGLGDLTGILGNSELTELFKNLTSGKIEFADLNTSQIEELAVAFKINVADFDTEGLTNAVQQAIDNVDTSKLENITYVPVIAAGPNGETFSFLEDGSLTISGTVGINSSDIQSVTTAVNQNMMAIGNVAMRTAETRDAVNSLANTVARLEDDILRMRVMLYPDIIAGYVDKYQYNQLMRP